MAKAIESLLDKFLEKIVDVFGDKAAVLLDASTRQKRASFEMFHALRKLEDILERIVFNLEYIIGHADGSSRRPEFAQDWPVQDYDALTQGFPSREGLRRLIFEFALALDKAEQAFKVIDAHFEIYGSRHQRNELLGLLDSDSIYRDDLFFGIFRPEENKKIWRDGVGQLLKSAKRAREIVAEYIKANFPLSKG